jgi:hypothetical protein
MIARRALLQLPVALQLAKTAQSPDREYWLSTLHRIANPVLTALSQGKLKATMPVEASHHNEADRRNYTYLEALGRLLTGIAPWLESAPGDSAEAALRQRYADLARAAIRNAVDPASPDYMNFSQGQQPVVDAAFLAQAILRAPTELWQKLDATAKSNLLKSLRATRAILPGPNNWLLFAATIEACLCQLGEDWDKMRVDYAIRQHEQWYKGDGVYGDGATLHWDYYKSFVIQPMLLNVLDAVSAATKTWERMRAPMLERARRYAAIEERLISPEGTYPAVGRSLAYRFGAFQVLALMALRNALPEGVSPEQVRCALTAVIRRSLEARGTFDANGWLTIGFCGHQPSMGEAYISTGSLYLCSAVLLPLGLGREDRFWSGPARSWSMQKLYSGDDLPADHAISV